MRAHSIVCQELGETYRELAGLEAMVLRNERAAWETSAETTVTGRAAHVKNATADLAADGIELKGDIRALETELRSIEWELTHG